MSKQQQLNPENRESHLVEENNLSPPYVDLFGRIYS